MTCAYLPPEEAKLLLKALNAITDSIEEAGRISESDLKNQLHGRVDLTRFDRIIRSMMRAGIITRENSTLIWIGGVK